MAEGVACVDGNGSFDNQNRRSCTYRVRVDLQDRLARLLYRHGQSLKSPQRNPTGGYRYPLKHSESVKFQVRTWNIPESECFNNRASFGVETSGRFLSSVHVDTAALLAWGDSEREGEGEGRGEESGTEKGQKERDRVGEERGGQIRIMGEGR